VPDTCQTPFFVNLNGKWLKIPPDDLYQLAVWVAESRPLAREGTILAIKDTLQKFRFSLK
jgi:hypothetical protein